MRACDRCGCKDRSGALTVHLAVEIKITHGENYHSLGRPDLCSQCQREVVRDLNKAYHFIMRNKSMSHAIYLFGSSHNPINRQENTHGEENGNEDEKTSGPESSEGCAEDEGPGDPGAS